MNWTRDRNRTICEYTYFFLHLHPLNYHQSNSNHNTGILIPAQHRILPTPHLRVFHIRPSPEEVLVGHDAGQAAGDGAVDVLHDAEIGGKEDVEVALMDQWCANQYGPPLISRLHHGSRVARYRLRQGVEVGGYEAVGGEARVEDGEELH